MSEQPPVVVSIVVPCYRSGAWLESLASRIVAVMEAAGTAFEILSIDIADVDVGAIVTERGVVLSPDTKKLADLMRA